MTATVNHGRFGKLLLISGGISISFLLIAASALSLMAASPADADDPLAILIARTGVAANYDHARPRSIHTRGTIELDGFTGTFESWHDLADGRYAEIIKAGPLSRAHGFNGSNGWYEDAKGIVLPRSAPFALAAICDYRFLLTGQLFQPNYGGAEVSYLGRRSERGKSYEAITVKPKGGHQMEWWFDDTSGLLARKIERSAGRTTVTSYSNYDDVGGAMIPGRGTSAVDGDMFEAFTISEFDANPANIERHLSMPASESKDYFISGGETHIPLQLIEHFQLIDSLDVKVLDRFTLCLIPGRTM